MFQRIILLCLCLSVAHIAYAEVLGGNINFLLGQRTMLDDDWDDFEVQDQGLFGLNVDLKVPVVPGIEFGFLTSREEGDSGSIEADVALTDFFIGLNKTWDLPAIHPFIGGGISFRTISTDLDIGAFNFDDDDTDLAFYIHAGAFWRIGNHFNIGADVRTIIGGEMDLFDDDVNANSAIVSLILGYGF